MKFKNLFQRIFIDGLGGMGLGLFATLIIGTIIQQVGTLIGGTVGSTLFLLGKIAAAMTAPVSVWVLPTNLRNPPSLSSQQQLPVW